MAHFLEADLQPWAAALANSLGLFASEPQLPLPPTPSQPRPPFALEAVPAASDGPTPCEDRQLPGDALAPLDDAADVWRRLDELAPLGDAVDAVLRTPGLPLHAKLPRTPAQWQPAVIRSHAADGALTLFDEEAVACSGAMHAVCGVHSLALELTDRPRKSEYEGKIVEAACSIVRSQPALQAFALRTQCSCMASLAPALGRLSQLARLDLSHCRLDHQGSAAHLAEHLGHFTALTFLDLGGNCIRTNGTCTLAQPLGRLTALASLNLRDINLYDIGPCNVGARALVEPLGRLTALTFLDLSGNRMGEEGWQTFAPALRRLSRLEHLGLTPSFDPVDEVLATTLGELTKLTSLTLRDCNNTEALAPALSRLSRLARLDLGGAMLCAADCAALAPALAALTALTSLDISDSHDLGAADVQALVHALGCLSRLATVNLTDWQLGSVGAATLAPSLGALTTLTLSLIHI